MPERVHRGDGVIHRKSNAGVGESASVLRQPGESASPRLEAYDAMAEIADLVERCAHHQGGVKALAAELDVAYSTVRDWVARPARFPLAKLPRLLDLAPPRDPFVRRFAAHLGYRLLPLFPSPDQIIEALREAGVQGLEVPEIRRTARRVIQGMDRQGHLWRDEP